LISPIARSSSHATSFSMRLTFRLRPPSPTRILLIFCYRTYSPRLLRPPRTLGTRRPWKMPATPSGWIPSSFGMALPTGCPRASARLLQPALRRPCTRGPGTWCRRCCTSYRRRAATAWRRPAASSRLHSSSGTDPASRASSRDDAGRGAAGTRSSTTGDSIPDGLLAAAHQALRLLCGVVTPGFSAARQLSCRPGRPKLAGGDDRRIQGAHGQWHLAPRTSTAACQCHHRQVGL